MNQGQNNNISNNKQQNEEFKEGRAQNRKQRFPDFILRRNQNRIFNRFFVDQGLNLNPILLVIRDNLF